MIDRGKHPRLLMLDPGREVTQKEIDVLAFQIEHYLPVAGKKAPARKKK